MFVNHHSFRQPPTMDEMRNSIVFLLSYLIHFKNINDNSTEITQIPKDINEVKIGKAVR